MPPSRSLRYSPAPSSSSAYAQPSRPQSSMYTGRSSVAPSIGTQRVHPSGNFAASSSNRIPLQPPRNAPSRGPVLPPGFEGQPHQPRHPSPPGRSIHENESNYDHFTPYPNQPTYPSYGNDISDAFGITTARVGPHSLHEDVQTYAQRNPPHPNYEEDDDDRYYNTHSEHSYSRQPDGYVDYQAPPGYDARPTPSSRGGRQSPSSYDRRIPHEPAYDAYDHTVRHENGYGPDYFDDRYDYPVADRRPVQEYQEQSVRRHSPHQHYEAAQPAPRTYHDEREIIQPSADVYHADPERTLSRGPFYEFDAPLEEDVYETRIEQPSHGYTDSYRQNEDEAFVDDYEQNENEVPIGYVSSEFQLRQIGFPDVDYVREFEAPLESKFDHELVLAVSNPVESVRPRQALFYSGSPIDYFVGVISEVSFDGFLNYVFLDLFNDFRCT